MEDICGVEGLQRAQGLGMGRDERRADEDVGRK